MKPSLLRVTLSLSVLVPILQRLAAAEAPQRKREPAPQLLFAARPLLVFLQGGSETRHALAESRLTVGHRGVFASRRRLPQGQTYIYLVLRG